MLTGLLTDGSQSKLPSFDLGGGRSKGRGGSFFFCFLIFSSKTLELLFFFLCLSYQLVFTLFRTNLCARRRKVLYKKKLECCPSFFSQTAKLFLAAETEGTIFCDKQVPRRTDSNLSLAHFRILSKINHTQLPNI